MNVEHDEGPETMLSVRGVEYRYTSRSTPLLQDVSFDCPAGTLTAIEGQNGSGKSTLLELCAGLRKPMHGSVERYARFSYLPQVSSSLLSNLTSLEHARLFGAACGMSGADAVAALKSLLERLDFINADIGSTLARLSGRSRQKLSLALSLLDERARLYLLDEPYAGFDAASWWR